MLLRNPLDELDASEVFPVSHGLLEQGLVSAGKIPIDLVRDYTVVPYTFLACSRGSSCPPREPVSRRSTFVRQILWFMLHVVELYRT